MVEDPAAQTQQALANVGLALNSVGGSLADVYKVCYALPLPSPSLLSFSPLLLPLPIPLLLLPA